MPLNDRHQTFRSEVIRISFREFFYVLFVVTLVIVNGYMFFVVGVRNPLVYILPVPLFVAATWALALVVMRNRFTVRLEPDVLTACDWLCKYESVSWDSVTQAKVWPMMGLSYLRILSSESKRPLWFPLNVENPERLTSVLDSYVEPDHPIAKALRHSI